MQIMIDKLYFNIFLKENDVMALLVDISLGDQVKVERKVVACGYNKKN